MQLALPHLLVLLASLALPTPPERAFLLRLAQAAEARTRPPTPKVTYDPKYVAIGYPNGDVPPSQGVCADVLIRSYRALGIDLQKLVHADMAAHFSDYPRLWKLKHPDTNIDHRRVPNLRVFFARHGTSLKLTQEPADFLPGDVVSWSVPPALPHIGIVSTQKSASGTPLIVHNIGGGEVLEDVLFAFEMTGHYRYAPR
jgi:uncharacterized protein YijF (DUF1287 family)